MMTFKNQLYTENNHLVFSDTQTFRKILGIFRLSHLPDFSLDDKLDELLIQSLIEENAKYPIYQSLSLTHFKLGSKVINNHDDFMENIIFFLYFFLDLRGSNADNNQYNFVCANVYAHFSRINKSNSEIIEQTYHSLKSILLNDSKNEFLSLAIADGLSAEEAEDFFFQFYEVVNSNKTHVETVH